MTETETEITAIRAEHPICGSLRFETVRQDRRLYYRLLANSRSGGSLTDEKHARETIAYWRANGWIVD